MFFVYAGIFKSKKPGPSIMGRPGVLAIMALVLHKHGDRALPILLRLFDPSPLKGQRKTSGQLVYAFAV
jgi:hypothetical protein